MDTFTISFRFYSVGKLPEEDVVNYVRTHALMYEYYRQAQEIVPPHIGKVLHRLFQGDAYKIVNTRLSIYAYILKVL